MFVNVGTILAASNEAELAAVMAHEMSHVIMQHSAKQADKAQWTSLLAGLAGALEVTGPLGQLTPHLPVGYGFTGIIVAFVGRLHPLGCVLASVLLSTFLIGGEQAQSTIQMPAALTGVFQGVLLLAMLACDTFILFRVRRVAPALRAGRAT